MTQVTRARRIPRLPTQSRSVRTSFRPSESGEEAPHCTVPVEELAGGSWRSQRAMTALGRQLPMTLTDVRAISISASTPRMMKIGSVGR